MITDYPADNFLETTVFALVLADDLDLPTLGFCIAGIHAEQIAGKNRRFITASTRPNFQKHIAAIKGILG